MNKIIELRTSEMKNYESTHHYLAAKLDFPPYYGHNLDALWDCLTADLALPVTIHWYVDDESSEDYTAITSLFEEAAGEVDGLEFGYIIN